MSSNKDSSGKVSVSAQSVSAIRFKQWLDIWDNYPSVKNGDWTKPDPFIYLFSMKAGDLRNLSDVFRRKYDGNIPEGVQRAQDSSRTSKIQQYVQYGYPYGDLPLALRNNDQNHLKKPGWLPTAIVINILEQNDQRRGAKVSKKHLVQVQDSGGSATLQIPEVSVGEDEDYLAPFEVIDGQHRLWSFGNDEQSDIPSDFELPVVAFKGLDIHWQAYLFWSINVSPKRINKSHAFDLYPLLRAQEWLESVGELNVYREARAQELTQLMYVHEKSAWHHRINMLGDKGVTGVSQNAWVSSLTRSFFGTGRGASSKGLFQADLGEDGDPLPWSRGQQGAFLLQFWNELHDQVVSGAHHAWIKEYKGSRSRAFEDKTSMLNQDMGLRAVHGVANDIFALCADDWKLYDWPRPKIEDPIFEVEASAALETIAKAPFLNNIQELAKGIAAFDWRSLDGPGVRGTAEETLKRSFRGSGGYTALKKELLQCLLDEDTSISGVAQDLLEKAN